MFVLGKTFVNLYVGFWFSIKPLFSGLKGKGKKDFWYTSSNIASTAVQLEGV